MITQLSAVLVYFLLALVIGILSYKRQTSSSGFLIGNRSLNYWLTALAAHASDMSNWLFMAYPAMIFMGGIFNAWIAIGLTLCMLLNWQLIAPKIRVLTEKTHSLTLSSFFEERLGDRSGVIRVFSAGTSCLFYTVYIAAGLVGLGELAHSLFGISYEMGILCGIVIIVLYVLIGGFITLAWLDLFQGLFLMAVILFIPLYLLPRVGGFGVVQSVMQVKNLSFSLIPTFSGLTFFQILFMSLGWGLGYFGQPHIITKFMGIQDASKITQSKRVGMAWMVLSLAGATLVGIVAIGYFSGSIYDSEMVFVEMVKQSFHPFLMAFILCAVIAAIINVVSSQMLVLSSILTEDFYKRIYKNKATDQKLLRVSRLGIVGVALFAVGVAFIKPSSIYSLVLYAWSGLGAAFGPLLLYVIYSKKATKFGAWAGILSGSLVSALWPYINTFLPIDVEPLLPAFTISFILNWAVSQITYPAKVPYATTENVSNS